MRPALPRRPKCCQNFQPCGRLPLLGPGMQQRAVADLLSCPTCSTPRRRAQALPAA